MEKCVSRKRALLGFWLRVACFALMTTLLLSYVCYVLTPKHDYGMCAMLNLYFQPKNSVDVLVLGTSAAYAAVNTNVLWQEQGIAAYNLCSAEQPFYISYYYLKEALKTQSPKLILLDAKPAIYRRDYAAGGRVALSTSGILSPLNRLAAINASVPKEEFWDYALALPKLHTNYRKLTAKDFVFPPDNGGRTSAWKGYIEMDVVKQHQPPLPVWVDTKRPLNPRQEEYARKIFTLASEKGIPVLLIGFPNPDYAHDHMFYNTLWSIAAEYGIGGINYNARENRFGLRYASDFADWQHLNVSGSVKLSKKLCEDLAAQFSLPDHRGDGAYASYDVCAARWFKAYPAYQGKGET